MIDFFHKKKIILRDIRPDNVYLINKQGSHEIRIKDLKNIVQVGSKRNGKLKKKVGNPYFLAPEMIK